MVNNTMPSTSMEAAPYSLALYLQRGVLHAVREGDDNGFKAIHNGVRVHDRRLAAESKKKY